ncbi:MAG: AAA family ATPase, partial [Candidatus Omnitrophota bacterium]
GETGLGKDELVRAAARLMNEEVYFIAGNYDMEPEDLFAHATAGVKEAGTTGDLYTAFNQIMHNGGWVVVDEINKVKPKVLGTLKTSIAGKTHERFSSVNGIKEKITCPNHPRARVIGTLNNVGGDIEQAPVPDQAIQDRLCDIQFVWRDPKSEKELQYALALRKLRKHYPSISNAELSAKSETARKAVDVLVDIAWPMRLTFKGYDAGQKTKLMENNFRNWNKLLRDKNFIPQSPEGKNLKKAPSPRAIGNIIEHAILFPETWENAPLTVAGLWFNLLADNMSPQERERQWRGIVDQFNHPPVRGGMDGLEDKSAAGPVKLTEDSFRLEGEYLVITPVPSGKNGKPAKWDTIRLWIHEDARDAFIKYGLPEEILYWLSTGNEYNAKQLYLTLQVRAMGKSLIYVGDQGTGKSFLAQAVAELIDGPVVPSIEIRPDTDKEELTFRQAMDNFVTRYDPGPIPVGLRDKKTVVIEEGNQGKPGVTAVLNEAIERQFFTHVDGSVWGEEGDGRFGVINTVNPPGSGSFYVKPFSREYIERHAVLGFAMLSPEEMLDYLLFVADRNGLGVNRKILGNKRLDSAGNPVIVNGEEKWDGLAGVIQYLRVMKNENPANKKLPPRIPGLRALKGLIKSMNSYWESSMAFYDGMSQDLLFEMFSVNFVTIGDARAEGEWSGTLREAFRECGLISADRDTDGLEAYLEGEDVIVQKLPVIRKPDTKIFNADRILTYLEENTIGSSVERSIRDLEKEVNELKNEWDKISFDEKISRLYSMREIWQVLEIIEKELGGKKRARHTRLNIELMRNVQSIIQAHILGLDWPLEFLEREENEDSLKARYAGITLTGESGMDNMIFGLALNTGEADYERKISDGLKRAMEEIKISSGILHEEHEKMAILFRAGFALDVLCSRQTENEEIKNLRAALDTVLSSLLLLPDELKEHDGMGTGWLSRIFGLAGIEEADISGILTDDSIAAGKILDCFTKLKEIVNDSRKQQQELMSAVIENEPVLTELYRELIIRFIKREDGILKDNRIDIARELFEIWKRAAAVWLAGDNENPIEISDAVSEKIKALDKAIAAKEKEIASDRSVASGKTEVSLNSQFGAKGDGRITEKEGKFSTPEGIAIDPSGNIWVANAGSHTVTVLDKTGRLNTAIGQGGIISEVEGKVLRPGGIAIDPSGNIWVVNWKNSTVIVLDKTGHLNTAIGQGGIITAEEGKFS